MASEGTRYFDYAASNPPFPEALDAFAEASRSFPGNPSSVHDPGREAREEAADLKREFMKLCGFESGKLVLTSGCTESNNLVIHGVMESHPEGRLLLAIDVHASAWWAKQNYAERTDVLSLGEGGWILPEHVERAVDTKTALVCMSHGSNESGVVHDIDAIAKVCASKGVLLMIDGAQTLGHIPVDLSNRAPDFFTFSAHKMGAPRGAGGVLMRGEPVAPQILGGGQEEGLRAGTENVAGLAALVAALRKSQEMIPAEEPRLRALGRKLCNQIAGKIPDSVVNTPRENSLPGFVSASIPGVKGPAMVTELNLMGFAVSAGSACQANKEEPSRVMLGLGRSEEEALGALRISMGRDTTEADVDALAAALAEAVERQRALA